jgi:hypothetical protein
MSRTTNSKISGFSKHVFLLVSYVTFLNHCTSPQWDLFWYVSGMASLFKSASHTRITLYALWKRKQMKCVLTQWLEILCSALPHKPTLRIISSNCTCSHRRLALGWRNWLTTPVMGRLKRQTMESNGVSCQYMQYHWTMEIIGFIFQNLSRMSTVIMKAPSLKHNNFNMKCRHFKQICFTTMTACVV